MNLATLAEQALDRHGERESLVFNGQRFKNTDLHVRARRLQRGLEELGIRRGEFVVLVMINNPAVYEVFGAIFRTGATVVPVMFMLTELELRFVLEDTQAKTIVTDAFNLSKVVDATKGLDFVEHIVVRGGAELQNSSVIDLDTLYENTDLPAIANIDADNDVALMLYTSGTTGTPKGVMLTHANLIAAAESSTAGAELADWPNPRIGVSAMPMAHIFGVSVMTSGYLAPKELEGYLVQLEWFDPIKIMQTIQEHRCNVMPAVPTMLSILLNHPEASAYDLSSLREVVCGAAPLPVELARAFMKRHGCFVREVYGMTENAGIASANRRSHGYRPGSAGRASLNVELRIVDDDDQPLPAGERGEIVTRGPTVMKGYYRRPDATAEALRGGFLHTGDIGYLDEEGFLYIVDRKKDMIIKGGENIYPAELEAVLHGHPGIAEAAVVGILDTKYGETVVAFVAPKHDAEVTESDVLSYLAERVSKFKLPEAVHIRNSLPKLGVGKILRRELRLEADKLRAKT